MVKRLNWSRALPRPLIIPDVMTITTLADVRTLLRHLPADHRAKSTWRYVELRLAHAAEGLDTVHVSVPLQMVLTMEGVHWRA